MIGFDSREIILSVIYATAGGVIFSILYSALHVLRCVLINLKADLKRPLMSERLLSRFSFKNIKIEEINTPLTLIFSILLFAILFMIISYITLDGEIRLYMLVLLFASFYMSKFAIFSFLCKPIVIIFTALLSVAFLPFKLIYSSFNILLKKLNV